MLEWLKRRQRTTTPTTSTDTDAPRLLADGKPSRYVDHDDPHRFEGSPPPLHLVPYGPGNLTLCEDSTGLLVGPTDRRLAKVGLHVAKARGEKYHPDACRAGDFTPGSTVRLVPEPNNPHDPNAVAVTEDRDDAPVAAYIAKGHARRFARLLASGEPLRIISIRGTGPGVPCEGIALVAAHPDLVEHLLSRRPRGLPRPQTR